jgi:hypothetical protein
LALRIVRLILDPLKEPGGRPCGARLGYVGEQPEVSQDSLNHRRLFNQRDQMAPRAQDYSSMVGQCLASRRGHARITPFQWGDEL